MRRGKQMDSMETSRTHDQQQDSQTNSDFPDYGLGGVLLEDVDMDSAFNICSIGMPNYAGGMFRFLVWDDNQGSLAFKSSFLGYFRSLDLVYVLAVLGGHWSLQGQ